MTLYERIAEKLGWPLKDVQSFSLRTLRDIVAPLSSKLAYEITQTIKSNRLITGDENS